MTDCTIRAFDGCSCKEGECHSKAVALGRFTKHRPEPYQRPFYAASAVAFAAVWGLFIALNGGF